MGNLLHIHTPPITAEFRNVYQAIAAAGRAQLADPGSEPGVQEELGVAQFSYALNMRTRNHSGTWAHRVIMAVTSGSYVMTALRFHVLLADPLDSFTHVNFSVRSRADRTHPDTENHPGEIITGGNVFAQWDWTSWVPARQPSFGEPINVADNDLIDLWVQGQHDTVGGAQFRYKALISGEYIPTDGPEFPVGVIL